MTGTGCPDRTRYPSLSAVSRLGVRVLFPMKDCFQRPCSSYSPGSSTLQWSLLGSSISLGTMSQWGQIAGKADAWILRCCLQARCTWIGHLGGIFVGLALLFCHLFHFLLPLRAFWGPGFPSEELKCYITLGGHRNRTEAKCLPVPRACLNPGILPVDAMWLPGGWASIPAPGEKQEALCALLHSSCWGPDRPQDVLWE